MNYKQCTLKKGNKQQTSWIPEKSVTLALTLMVSPVTTLSGQLIILMVGGVTSKTSAVMGSVVVSPAASVTVRLI